MLFPAGDLWNRFLEFLPRLGISLLIFLVAYVVSIWLTRLVDRALQRQKVDPELIVLLRLLTRGGVLGLGSILALENLSEGNLGSLVAGLGIAGFTIGFALQDVAKNLVAGILLLIQQPFGIGDTIEVAGFSGTVQKIALRTTEMTALDGRPVMIPNADVFVSPIINFSRASERRVAIKVGVHPASDLDLVARTALAAIGELDGLMPNRTPTLYFEGFGEATVEFILHFWIDPRKLDVGPARDRGVRLIKESFARSGISIPYPTLRVLTEEAGPSERGMPLG